MGVMDHSTVTAPPADWSHIEPHDHAVRFYDDDAVLLDGLNGLFGSALRDGDSAVVVATSPHRDGLTRRLELQGANLGRAVDQGRFIALDAHETLRHLMRGGDIDAERFSDLLGGTIAQARSAAKGKHSRVVVFGELVAILCAEGKHQTAERLEDLWNKLSRTQQFTLHCAYPMDVFGHAADAESFGRICAAHSSVQPSESFTGLVGEPDQQRMIASLQQKAQALSLEVEARKEAQRVLELREVELRDAVASRDVFLSIAAHELKTPLTSLRAFTQLLLRDTRNRKAIVPERLETALGTIELQTEKLSQLVSRLLDTAQIQAGKLRIQPTVTDLTLLVRSAIARRSGDGERVFHVTGSERIEAEVDPVRLEQVVTNLLDNAVKFSMDGSAVTIDLGHDGNGRIRLSVTDHGVGIPVEKRDAVFDRFQQAHGDRHLSGIGLGLHITREIVELHGGTVCIEGSDMPGTCVVVTLPEKGVAQSRLAE